MDHKRLIDIVIEKIRRDYPQEVDLVVIMGSTLYGDTHDKSDLDLYFVVNDPRGFELGMACIIDGVGFDLWPVSWDRLGRIAKLEERITSILTEGREVYQHNEEARRRFEELRDSALAPPEPGQRLHKAKNVFAPAYRQWFRIQTSNDLAEVRQAAVTLVNALAWTLALLNGTVIRRGRGKLRGEILAMPLIPAGFAELYEILFTSTVPAQIREAMGRLITAMEELMEAESRKFRDVADPAAHLAGFYEELINGYHKIRHAGATGDLPTALHAACEITQEIEEIFSGTGLSADDLPDLVSAWDPRDPSELLRRADAHQKAFEALLDQQGVPRRAYADLDELEREFKA